MGKPQVVIRKYDGRWYAATLYVDLGDGQIDPQIKFDVTDDINRILNEEGSS